MKRLADWEAVLRDRALPVVLSILAVGASLYLQEVGKFRRHAVLIALLIGLGFFHPQYREPLLLFFCYGVSLYCGLKAASDLRTWAELSPIEQSRSTVWLPVAILALIAAIGLTAKPPKPFAMPAIYAMFAVFFGGYTLASALANNWLQSAAGVGLIAVAAATCLSLLTRRPISKNKEVQE